MTTWWWFGGGWRIPVAARWWCAWWACGGGVLTGFGGDDLGPECWRQVRSREDGRIGIVREGPFEGTDVTDLFMDDCD
mgnify:FL=1